MMPSDQPPPGSTRKSGKSHFLAPRLNNYILAPYSIYDGYCQIASRQPADSVGVSTARRPLFAYASMAAGQFRNFINDQGLCWAFAALLSTLKAFIRPSPDRRISGK